MRKRAFRDLYFPNLRDKHHGAWEVLAQQNDIVPYKGQSLDDIAQETISHFNQQLFAASKSSILMTYQTYSKYLYEELLLALQDHLITVFAYCFSCDNLQLQSKSVCAKKLFNYEFGVTPPEFVDPESYRINAGKNLRKYKEYLVTCQNNLTKSMFEILAPYDVGELLAAPNWLFSSIMCTKHAHHPLNTNKQSDNLRFLDEKEDAFLQLYNFIQDRNNLHFLLNREEQYTHIPSLPYRPAKLATSTASAPYMSLCATDDNPIQFVSIPTIISNGKLTSLPNQNYKMKGSNKEIIIDSKTQIVYNNYLFEKMCHAYALLTIDTCIMRRQDSQTADLAQVRHILASALQVDAQLLQAPMIRFFDHIITLSGNESAFTVSAQIDAFIKSWNTIIDSMEEYFIWSVWSSYETSEDIFRSIDESMATGSPARFDRLNIYRLVRADSGLNIKVHPEIKQQHKLIMAEVYAALLKAPSRGIE